MRLPKFQMSLSQGTGLALLSAVLILGGMTAFAEVSGDGRAILGGEKNGAENNPVKTKAKVKAEARKARKDAEKKSKTEEKKKREWDVRKEGLAKKQEGEAKKFQKERLKAKEAAEEAEKEAARKAEISEKSLGF